MTARGVDTGALDLRRNVGYGTWRIPHQRDEEIAAAVAALAAAGTTATGDQAEVLLAFAGRMATLSRRLGSAEPLRRGLDAVCLAAASEDPREVALVLAPLWRSAEVLGLDPAAEFQAAAARVPEHGRVRAFADRSPEDRSLHAMGYAEDADDDGFRYRRTW